MIDHVTLSVSDLSAARRFYEAAFAPLGYRLSFGEEGRFWAFVIGDGLFEIQATETAPPLTPAHVAFRVGSRALVDAFHRAALDAGGHGNGAPGPRPAYTEHYYAAFVLDPDGHNIEAMIDG